MSRKVVFVIQSEWEGILLRVLQSYVLRLVELMSHLVRLQIYLAYFLAM